MSERYVFYIERNLGDVWRGTCFIGETFPYFTRRTERRTELSTFHVSWGLQETDRERLKVEGSAPPSSKNTTCCKLRNQPGTDNDRPGWSSSHNLGTFNGTLWEEHRLGRGDQWVIIVGTLVLNIYHSRTSNRSQSSGSYGTSGWSGNGPSTVPRNPCPRTAISSGVTSRVSSGKT